MMDKVKFSIVTSMFNSFSLMSRYFDSLEKQSFKNFEVIIIDDCSTDDSFAELMKFTQSTSLPIQTYKTDINSGPAVARNIGIEKASGEWITFIDNDDWVDNDFLLKINKIIETQKVNCIIYDYFTSNGITNNRNYSMYKVKNGIVDIRDAIRRVRNHTFGKFYKAEFLSNVRFPELRKCEDVGFVCLAISKCGSVYYYKEPLYYYLQRKDSLSNNTALDETDMIKAFSFLEKNIGEEYFDELKEKSVADLCYGVLLMMCKTKKTTKHIKRYLKEYGKKYPGWFNCKIKKDLGLAKNIFLAAAFFRQIWIMRLLAKVHGKLI